MAPRPPDPDSKPRRLIVNADDFGRSASINQAVIRAHREGILTTASLMVNEAAGEEAVALAREHPNLGVGLHLTLLCGHSALPGERIPGLVNASGEFTNNPASAGFRYFFQRSLREQLRREIHAQFQRFRATRLPLDHVNGHLHLHLHPTVFRILMADAAQLGIKHLRLTFDPFRLNLRLASGQLAYRALHAAIFHPLSARARPALAQRGIRHTEAVFGLLQNARVDEPYVTRLLPHLPAGDSELYSHPSLNEFRNEFDALISPTVKEQVRQQGIKLIRYQDL
jgi:hopanoid biosynthesis associated protein HpnK